MGLAQGLKEALWEQPIDFAREMFLQPAIMGYMKEHGPGMIQKHIIQPLVEDKRAALKAAIENLFHKRARKNLNRRYALARAANTNAPGTEDRWVSLVLKFSSPDEAVQDELLVMLGCMTDNEFEATLAFVENDSLGQKLRKLQGAIMQILGNIDQFVEQRIVPRAADFRTGFLATHGIRPNAPNRPWWAFWR